MSFHTIIVVGNLGRDPEMRYLPNGDPVTSMNVASSRSYTNGQGQKVDETVWFRVSIFGKMAESCNTYLKKGSKVLVEGRLNADKNGGPRVWTRQDGTPGASFEITAATVRFLSTRGEGGGGEGYGGGGGGFGGGQEPGDPGDSGDIPF
jgi:single-strand DNA-binding protein